MAAVAILRWYRNDIAGNDDADSSRVELTGGANADRLIFQRGK